jgi:hypothetical protein
MSVFSRWYMFLFLYVSLYTWTNLLHKLVPLNFSLKDGAVDKHTNARGCWDKKYRCNVVSVNKQTNAIENIKVVVCLLKRHGFFSSANNLKISFKMFYTCDHYKIFKVMSVCLIFLYKKSWGSLWVERVELSNNASIFLQIWNEKAGL